VANLATWCSFGRPIGSASCQYAMGRCRGFRDFFACSLVMLPTKEVPYCPRTGCDNLLRVSSPKSRSHWGGCHETTRGDSMAEPGSSPRDAFSPTITKSAGRSRPRPEGYFRQLCRSLRHRRYRERY